ncbi:MAG: hypothetical protein RIC35_08870 [Marinoscillum sp.]
MEKQATIDSIKELPDNFELEELFEHLLVLDKIEKGRKDIANNKSYTHQEVKKELGKWLK